MVLTNRYVRPKQRLEDLSVRLRFGYRRAKRSSSRYMAWLFPIYEALERNALTADSTGQRLGLQLRQIKESNPIPGVWPNLRYRTVAASQWQWASRSSSNGSSKNVLCGCLDAPVC